MGNIIDDAIAAIKADLDIDDMTDFLLGAAQQTQLMEAMEVQTRLLPIIRSHQMTRDTEHIDSIQFYGRVTHAGSNADGSVRTITEDDEAQPTGEHNTLNAKEFTAATAIRDRLLRRVIGQGSTGPFIVNLLGNAAGRDREEASIFGRKSIAYADDDMLNQADGFAVKSGKKLFGGESNVDFDPSDGQYPFTLFDLMLDELSDKYKDGLENYAFLVDWSEFNAALDMWGLRNTALGDQVLSTGILPPYKGVKQIYIPLLNRAKTETADLTKGHIGRVTMLQNVLNMNWGIFHEVTMEAKRVPEGRASKWYLSYEGDQEYQERNAAVTAFHSRESLS